jgi:hypothetical protein
VFPSWELLLLPDIRYQHNHNVRAIGNNTKHNIGSKMTTAAVPVMGALPEILFGENAFMLHL